MKLRFVASQKPAAQTSLQEMIRRYGQSHASHAEYIITLGGDGTALKALHDALHTPGPPVFPMRLEGSVGFLANRYDVLDLPSRLEGAHRIQLRPLEADVQDASGEVKRVLSLAEIVLMRQRLQAAKLRLNIGRAAQVCRLSGDGLLVATPLGSSGYNRSQGGPSLPLGSALLVLTGLAPLPASDWLNAVVSDHLPIHVEVVAPTHRPVRLETYLEDVRDVVRAEISISNLQVVLLRDKNELLLDQRD